jgi:hypothetical protein
LKSVLGIKIPSGLISKTVKLELLTLLELPQASSRVAARFTPAARGLVRCRWCKLHKLDKWRV